MYDVVPLASGGRLHLQEPGALVAFAADELGVEERQLRRRPLVARQELPHVRLHLTDEVRTHPDVPVPHLDHQHPEQDVQG